MKPKINYRELITDFTIPIVILAILTFFFRATNWDIMISGIFYNPETHTFPSASLFPWKQIYVIFPYIIIGLLVALCIIFLSSFLKPDNLKKYRKGCLFGILAIALGPGLLVNLFLKDNWGRPRPRDCKVFHGQYQFVKVCSIGPGGSNSSFPAGHPSMGFALFFLYFIFRKSKKRPAHYFYCISIISGIILGITRVVQGGHFTSDVIWSWGVVYLLCLVLYYIFRYDIPPEPK